VRIRVTDDLHRSRLTVFFRFLIAIPHLIWLTLWTIPVLLVAIFNWFATLIMGRTSEGVHSFIARWLRYSTHVNAYMYLAANPWPPFGGREGTYPVDLEIDPPAPQRRLVTFFRVILVIPAYVFGSLLGSVAQLVAFAGWFVALVLGRLPAGMRDLIAFCLRFQAQLSAYMLLLTDRYPSLGAGGGSA
jgi:hypothetical protein